MRALGGSVDVVAATTFGAAGMTFEEANYDPIAQRTGIT
jgi:hypothetical protein